jgi:hypothetical protein
MITGHCTCNSPSCPVCHPVGVVLCGPTHHYACSCREAAVAKLVEALERLIDCYDGLVSDDTLSEVFDDARAALDEFHGRKA